MTNSLFTHEAIKTTLPKAKELRRVAEPLITLGEDADAGESPAGVRSAARSRRRHQALQRAGPALQGASRRLPAHPQVRLPPGRRGADGAGRAGRSARRRRPKRPSRRRNAPSLNDDDSSRAYNPAVFIWRRLSAAGAASRADRVSFLKPCSIRSHARDSSGHRRRRVRRLPHRRRAGARPASRRSYSTTSATARRRSVPVSRRWRAARYPA